MTGFSVEPVGEDDRVLGFTDTFMIWFGAGVSIAEFWAGALLTPGLDLRNALLVILLGHLVGNLLLAFVALAGWKTGLPTMVLSRKILGSRGSFLPSILNYIQLIGWTGIMIFVGAGAASKVTVALTGKHLFSIWVITLGALVMIWALIGPLGWRLLSRISGALLLFLSMWLLLYIIRIGGAGSTGTGRLGFWVALDLVVAMPVSWAPLAADYGRFCKDAKTSFWGTFLGYFVSSSLMYIVGAVTNLKFGTPDPVELIALVGAGIPAFIIIVLSTVTTTFMDVYSAAMSFKNVVERSDARKHIILVTLLGIVLALVFPAERYEVFLLIIGGVFVPFSMLITLDFLFEHECYESLTILRGMVLINKGTLLVWMLGSIFYLLLSAKTMFGINVPILGLVADEAGCSLPTLVLTAILYVVVILLRRRTRL